MATRIIKTCPGIGDSIFLFQKLVNQPEKFHWQIDNGHPKRGHQIFEMMPQLTESFAYVPKLGYQIIKNGTRLNNWRQMRENQFYLQANSHLEAGKRIESFLPDLPTSYILPYFTTKDHSDKAESILSGFRHLVGIYGSAYSTARRWGGWDHNQWLDFIRLMGHDYVYVLIGAEWDVDMVQLLMPELDKAGIKYINTVGQPLQVVAEILKRLDMFVGFPSGLSILNETIGAKRTIMFHPNHLLKLMNTWADPARIASGAYKGCLFCEPKKIYDWVKENWLK